MLNRVEFFEILNLQWILFLWTSVDFVLTCFNLVPRQHWTPVALAWISTETGTHNGLMQRTLTGLNPPLDLLQPGDRTESSTMASTKSIFFVGNLQLIICLRNSKKWNKQINLIIKYGCFLKWWYPQNTPKLSFVVGNQWLLGTTILGNPHIEVDLNVLSKIFGFRGTRYESNPKGPPLDLWYAKKIFGESSN